MPAEPARPAATYISAAIENDSIDHFVVLMSPAEHRPKVETSIALTRVIENIPQRGNEPQIRQLKLNWWLEEIEMVAQGKPRHPLSIELSQSVDHQDWLQPLHGFVSHTLTDHARPMLVTLAGFLTYTHHAAERQVLIASVLPQCDELALAHARNNGVGICISESLSNQTGSRIPENGFEDQPAGTTVDKLATIAQEHFNASEPLPTSQRRAQMPVLLRARLHQQLLHRLQRNDFDPRRAATRPLLLLWQAWREARNLLK